MFSRWLGAAAFLSGALVFPAYADSTSSVDSAFKMCEMFDSTGALTQKCSVSGSDSSVSIWVDMTSDAAHQLCDLTISKVSGTLQFDSGWQLKIYSPYSGGNTIAFCDLPQ